MHGMGHPMHGLQDSMHGMSHPVHETRHPVTASNLWMSPFGCSTSVEHSTARREKRMLLWVSCRSHPQPPPAFKPGASGPAPERYLGARVRIIIGYAAAHMSTKRKRLSYLVSGAFLFFVCGPLVWLGYLFSWGLALAGPTDVLKFVFHPTTLLFLFSLWLLYKGFSIRDE